MGNIITCIKRIYSIQMDSGMQMEVESEKPLSGVTTAKLLEDDSEIGTFLDNIKILDIKAPQEQEIIHRSYKSKGKKLKKNAKIRRAKLKKETVIEENKITPSDRINLMITMEGEFTRPDYQKFMEDKGYKITTFMGHGDIEDAVTLKRITPTGEKVGGRFKKYRVIDVMPVEQYMYRKILKNVREKIKQH